MNTYLVVYLIGFAVVFALTALVGKKSDVGKAEDWGTSLISGALWPLAVLYGTFTMLGERLGWRK